MGGKVIHNEKIKDLLMKVTAKYENKNAIKVNDNWVEGRVILKCQIYNTKNELVLSFNNKCDSSISEEYPYHIGFKRKYERYGFLNIRRKEYLVHISEEYNRVYPLFLEYCQLKTKSLSRVLDRDNEAQKITDGLPDSLKDL